MPNPIRYDLHDCSAVRFRSREDDLPDHNLVAEARKWLARRLGMNVRDRAFFEAEERIDEAAFQTFMRNPHTEDGGVLT